MPRLDWIVDKAKQRVYPYTHADAVIMDDDNKKLRDTLDEVNEKFDHFTFSQSDWNETNPEQVSYIKNKPESLPANGGNSDTLDGKHGDEFASASDFDIHRSSNDSHINLFNKKLDVEAANSLFKDISFNAENGQITITRLNNTISTIDLPVELLLESGLFDNDTKEIVLILKDQSEIRIPAVSLVDIYTGKENDVIQVLVDSDNIISAIVKSGSISKSLFSTSLQTLLTSLEEKAHIHSNGEVLNAITNEVISKINSSYNHINDSLKHIPTGGISGNILKLGANGTAVWSNESVPLAQPPTCLVKTSLYFTDKNFAGNSSTTKKIVSDVALDIPNDGKDYRLDFTLQKFNGTLTNGNADMPSNRNSIYLKCYMMRNNGIIPEMSEVRLNASYQGLGGAVGYFSIASPSFTLFITGGQFTNLLYIDISGYASDIVPKIYGIETVEYRCVISPVNLRFI